jgi:flagellar biosynthesis protein FlhA
MNAQASGWLQRLKGLGADQGLAAPALLLLILGMMVVPLSPSVLDLMFTVNIAVSLVVLMAVIYVMRPMDFNAFPTVLLFVTLMRP